MVDTSPPKKMNTGQGRGAHSEAQIQPDPRQRILAVGLEVARRVAELSSLEDVYLFLVNDLRALIEFDRCFLINHMGGSSSAVAASNQPAVETRSKLFEKLQELAPLLVELQKALLLTMPIDETDPSLAEIPETLRFRLRDYLAFTESKVLLLLPLVHDGRAVAHLIMEFGSKEPPNQTQVVALLHVAPVLASILVERWLLFRKPHLALLAVPQTGPRSVTKRFLGSPWRLAAVAASALVLVLLVMPVNYTVGGQAEIVPWERRVAYCAVEGLIQTVETFEGAHVARGQALAAIDPTELDFKVESARREQEILRQQASLLGIESDHTPAKLAEAKILELKMQKTVNDLRFLEWQRQFLEVRAPVEGIVVTRDVESLAGKKLRAGEQFCEMAVPGELAADVFVPEDKVASVKQGKVLYLYLNNDPFKGYRLTVDKVSPVTEASTRLGNVCRVRARLVQAPPSIKVGMKGVGKIETGRRTLLSIVTQRLASRWNSFALRF